MVNPEFSFGHGILGPPNFLNSFTCKIISEDTVVNCWKKCNIITDVIGKVVKNNL